MRPLTVTLRTVTPLFLGGADANDCAELRAPSIKGLLRWWYRAVDPEYRAWEARIFGGTGRDEGQACASLRVVPALIGREPWGAADGKRYRAAPFQEGDRDEPINGLMYLGYSLTLGDNKRKAIPAGATFKLVLHPNRRLDARERRGLLAALWLLGHLGAAGSRSRRGFGSLRLESWDLGPLADEARGLPLAAGARTPKEWLAAVEQGLETLRGWFGRFPRSSDHAVLGSGVRLLLFEEGHAPASGAQAWELALGAIGKELQLFRRRLPRSDYDRAKAHLIAKHVREETSRARRTGRSEGEITRLRDDLETRARAKGRSIGPRDTIERAAFGLPLAFRFRSLNVLNPKLTATFEGTQHDRSASPLHLRVVQIGERCHALAVVTTAPLLPAGERLGEKRRQQPPDPRYAFDPPGRRLLDEFADRLKAQGAIERVLP